MTLIREISRVSQLRLSYCACMSPITALWEHYINLYEEKKPHASKALAFMPYSNNFGSSLHHIQLGDLKFRAPARSPRISWPDKNYIGLQNLESDGDDEFLGAYISDGYFYNFVDWDKAHLDEDSEQRGHPFKKILETLVDTYLEAWEPTSLTEAIFEGFKANKANREATINREIESMLREIRNYELSINQIFDRIREKRVNLIYLQQFSIEDMRSTLRGYEQYVLEMSDSLFVNQNSVVAVLKPFLIQDVWLGPLRIELNLRDCSVKVFPCEDAVTTDGYCHPHVDSSGGVCWGNVYRQVMEMRESYRPAEILATLVKMLREGYDPGSAYRSLNSFGGFTGWWCDVCKARHRDGQNCPKNQNAVTATRRINQNRVTFRPE